MSIICIAWKTNAMPTYSYVYYHATCYEATQPSWPNARTLELTTTDVAGQCAQCGKPLSQLPALSRATN